ncbi:hypothetical protein GCM10007242_45300 [Pigmentiphaga litoralis]|uniref:phage regulatory CII family protein n=1 Tax=Pigmentiphaga litoralis TaxID=516702 RepID=UPI001674A3DB|nr:phage regulatory CII family protein [Pigmentiphaga litoralis]GGX33153.1 hypothetical protein GCM10007242_45300 [Pigmentiphaga litoralis]
MNITDALYHAVHSYPGGAEAMAVRMGISSSSLQHKVNPAYPKAHCSPEEQAMICELANDRGPLIAFAARLDCIVLPLPAVDGAHDEDLMRRTSAACVEFGELITEVGFTTADGRVTDNELRRVEAGITDLTRALHTLLAGLQAMNQRDKSVSITRAA